LVLAVREGVAQRDDHLNPDAGGGFPNQPGGSGGGDAREA